MIAVSLGLGFFWGRSGYDSPGLGVAFAILGPVFLTSMILWATYTSLTRLGVSTGGLILVFPRRTLNVAWYALQPPMLGDSKSGPFIQFYWKDGKGKTHSFLPDPVSAKYILDHPSCPKWELSSKLRRALDDNQSRPWKGVKVRIEA